MLTSSDLKLSQSKAKKGSIWVEDKHCFTHTFQIMEFPVIYHKSTLTALEGSSFPNFLVLLLDQAGVGMRVHICIKKGF